MKPFTILVVDDDEQILDFLRPKLRGSGYNVLTAGNGVEALEQAKAQEPDLLVLDLMMPGMDGFETLTLEELTIDFEKHFVIAGGEEKYLTNIEWLLLAELARNAGRVVTYHYLLTRVWGPEYREDVQLVRSWLSRLRRKIEKDPDNPRLIRNLPKVGYILNQPSA